MPTTIELEHAIGYNGRVENGLQMHPNNINYIYPAGACVVKSDKTDPHEQEFLRGHDDDITTLAISSTGKYIASGQRGSNADVCVWDFEKSTLIYRLTEHEHEVAAVAFTEDEKLLLTCGGRKDNRVLVWDMSSGYIVASAHLPVKQTTSQKSNDGNKVKIAWGGNTRDIKRRKTGNYQFATAINKSELILWTLDPYKGALTSKNINTQGYVRVYTALAFDTASNEYIIAGSTSGDISIASTRTHNIVMNTPVCHNGVRTINMIKEKDEMKGMVIGGGDGKMVYMTGEEYEYKVATQPLNISKYDVANCSHQYNKQHNMLVGSGNGDIVEVEVGQLNQLASAKPRLQTENHYGAVTKVSFPSKVSDRFATCSDDGTVRFWDLSSYATLSSASFKNTPTSLTFVHDVAYIGFHDGTIRSMDTLNSDILWDKPLSHQHSIEAMTSASTGKFIVSGDDVGVMRVWSIHNKQLLTTFSEHRQGIQSLTMFNDDVHVLTCSKDRSIFCVDLQKNRRVSTYTHKMGGVNDIALFDDQTRFISVGSNRYISIWDIRQSKPIALLDYQPAEPTCVSISNDNMTFAVGGTDEVVHLYDATTNKVISEGDGHSNRIQDLSFTYDDKQLVSVGDDGCIFVWNQFTS
mmetsp:Transcript_6964/g.10193  ORF Transcript_6964/g.10193 Transcript_6964/m.10193 type:complete len:635 (+) Transcript_6964:20-1924(+)